MIRIGGTSEFVSKITPVWGNGWPDGDVETVEGWERTEALKFETMDEALVAAEQVWNIEGFHTSVEPTNWVQ
jgi:hypothetical protein